MAVVVRGEGPERGRDRIYFRPEPARRPPPPGYQTSPPRERFRAVFHGYRAHPSSPVTATTLRPVARFFPLHAMDKKKRRKIHGDYGRGSNRKRNGKLRATRRNAGPLATVLAPSGKVRRAL